MKIFVILEISLLASPGALHVKMQTVSNVPAVSQQSQCITKYCITVTKSNSCNSQNSTQQKLKMNNAETITEWRTRWLPEKLKIMCKRLDLANSKLAYCRRRAVFNKENSFLSDLSFESNFKIESNLEFPNSVGKKLREIRLQSKVYFKLPSGLIHPWTTRQSTPARWDTSKTVENLHFYLKYNATSNF